MISLYDRGSIDAALAQPLDPSLRKLIADHLGQADHEGLADLTHLIVIQPGDDEATIQAEIGFSPLVNPIDGDRWGEPGWAPHCDWLEDEGSAYLLIKAIGDSGFAFILLIEKAAGVWPELLEMCQHYSDGAGE